MSRARAARSWTSRCCYRDAHLLVVDKPAGLLVHPVPGYGGPTLVHGLLHEIGRRGPAARHRPPARSRHVRAAGGGARRPHAGAAAVAPAAAAHPPQLRGPGARPAGLAARHHRGADRPRPPRPDPHLARLGRRPRGRHALRDRRSCCEGRTLLDVELETGRTHQIRVHLAAIGYPVVGDRVYGHGPELGLERQFLHAARLRFPHPWSGEQVDVALAAAARPGGGAGAGAAAARSGRRTGFPLESSARFRSSTFNPAGISRPVVPRRSCGAPVVSAGTYHQPCFKEAIARARSHHARAAGGRRPLRPPDAALEPEDAPVHLRRARRHLHHRSAADDRDAAGRLRLRPQHRRARRHGAVRGHQEAGPGRASRSRPAGSASPTSTTAGWAAC